MRPVPASTLFHPLDELLGSPALVRVARTLVMHGGMLAVSDIAARTKLSLPSVRSALARFSKLEVVHAVGAGKSMVFGLQRSHPLSGTLTALFEDERRQAALVLDALRAAAAELTPPPIAMWLYGSVARGEDGAASDIDIALVSSESRPTAQAEAVRETIAETLPAWSHRISVVALGRGDVQRARAGRTRFWRELERDAVVLVGESPVEVRGRLPRGKRA